VSNPQVVPKPDVFGCPTCGRELLALSYTQRLPTHPTGSRIRPDLKCPSCGRRYQSSDLAVEKLPAHRDR
jgi:primosomal protein N'